MRIIDFSKDSISVNYLFEYNCSVPVTSLQIEIVKPDERFPYILNIIDDRYGKNEILQRKVPYESLYRRFNDYTIENRRGYVIIHENEDGYVDIINEMVFNTYISSQDFNNEFYELTNPLDSLESNIQNIVNKNSGGYLIFIIMGNNAIINKSDYVYNKEDISKGRFVQYKNKGNRPLSFLDDYNTSLRLRDLYSKCTLEHQSVPSDTTFLYIGRIDLKSNKLVSDIFNIGIQTDSNIIIPMKPDSSETQEYLLSPREENYSKFNINNMIFYGINPKIPFNMIMNENKEIEDEEIYDKSLNKKFIKRTLLQLNNSKLKNKFNINKKIKINEF